ncbi:hypothetical protein HY386_00460 [Candidatus Daviesbacteria bacterium]|nr:hypothetical protein [Candidatus Daviesbacteria bacterium]
MHLSKGFIHIPVLVILLIVASVTAVLISQNPNPNTKGVMIAHQGEDDGDRSGSGSSGSGSSGSSESKKEDKNDEQIIETKSEVKFSENEKIKTEIKKDRQRIDVYSGGVKVRYEIRDGRAIIKAETEEGAGIPEQELFKIVDRVDKSGIKIATAGGKLLVTRNNVGALSNFPLQIDLNTNQLIASTSAGPRVLTILPDRAVQNMLAANVISRLGPPFIRNAIVSTASGQLTSVSDVVTLGLQNNVPVYEIPGIRDFKLLGFIPVSQPLTAIVSAETGELVETQKSLMTKIIDLLSP